MANVRAVRPECSSIFMRVLSIQSHVVHGYVGNKAATLPLQLLGYDVDPINTVHFSNHTGYPKFTGSKLSSSQFEDIISGLEVNGILHQYSMILTGYVGNHEVLAKVIDLCSKLRNNNVLIVVDPVMGDNGSLYVHESYPSLYRNLIAHADLITPNGFEAELLAESKLTPESLTSILERLHALGPKFVVITSFEWKNRLFLIGSSPDKQFYIQIPKVHGIFTGTGDLFAAILVGHLNKVGFDRACNRSASALKTILENTSPGKELRIPKYTGVISNPEENFTAKPITEMLSVFCDDPTEAAVTRPSF